MQCLVGERINKGLRVHFSANGGCLTLRTRAVHESLRLLRHLSEHQEIQCCYYLLNVLLPVPPASSFSNDICIAKHHPDKDHAFGNLVSPPFRDMQSYASAYSHPFSTIMMMLMTALMTVAS